MNLKIVIHGTELRATLIDSETSKDFVSLLPLTLTMNDLFGREKLGHLPERSPPTAQTHACDVGDIAYWSPGPDVAMFSERSGTDISPLLHDELLACASLDAPTRDTLRSNEGTPADAGVLRVELGGLEPPTSWVRSRRSPN